MRTRRTNSFRTVALIAAWSLLVAPGGAGASLLQTSAAKPSPAPAPAKPTASPAPAKPTASAAQARPAAATAPDEWPRYHIAADGSQVVVYQPQVASWDDQKLLTLYAAVSYLPKGSQMSLLGTITAESDTRVAVDDRLVDFTNFRITRSNFPQASREQAAAAVEAIKSTMATAARVIALDRVLAYLDASSIRARNLEGVKADPPVIFFSSRPAVIVNVDGDPIWSPIKDNELRFAVNTNWDLFEHPPSKAMYLRHERMWLTAVALDGPWAAATTLPESFRKLPSGDDWADVRAAMPPVKAAAPIVFTSTKPAELILLSGEPQYRPVQGTQLQWVSNTNSDVFRLGAKGTVYYLVAGRWFAAPDFNGPWTFATPSLPADFARIPLEHERSRVLASVPGTVQAAEAVLLAQVPQTARVNKKQVQAPEVSYRGDPDFQPVEKTSVTRAVNTDKDVIKVGDLYYLCFQGVWFMSRTPTGPWEVTGEIPAAIYEIPISSPVHHVTYVTVEDDDDDEWVTYATAAAYGGVMVAWGCAVWGSGWYYPPYVWYGGGYPGYFPYYPTYGYSAWYNPWTGTYGRGAGVYGPYGGAGIGARYNPRTGTYARGAVAYGPYGARGAASAYNPRTGTFATTRQGSNVYGSWGATGVQRGDNWAATARTTNRVTDTTTRATRTSEGGAAVSRRGPDGGGFVGTSGSGDVYAGRDGSVYRKQGDSWQKFDNGAWGGVDAPSQNQLGTREADRPSTADRQAPRSDPATVGQLDRDAAARRDGATRTQHSTGARSGSSTYGGGSYRPSGGAPRGGGGGGGRRR